MSDRSSRISFTRRLHRRGLRIVLPVSLGAALAAVGCTHLAEKERELTFRVVPGNASWYSGLPDDVIETYLPVRTEGGNERMHAWWWPADDADAPALLYLHGARWNLTGHMFRIRQLRDFGFSVLAVDYRGFGKSDGKLPSEQTVYEDARIAWEHLATLQPDHGRRFIYGHSLGGAVAIDLAANLAAASKKHGNATAHPPAHGLIVESSFTTLADIARAHTYPWLPLQFLLSQRFDSVEKIAQVDMPVLIVHGTDDRYVPSRFSEKLFEAAPAQKRLLLVDGGTHNNSMRVGRAAYRKAFEELFGWPPESHQGQALSGKTGIGVLHPAAR